MLKNIRQSSASDNCYRPGAAAIPRAQRPGGRAGRRLDGGVRLPELDVPTASYFSPNNTGKPACGAGAPPFPGCNPPALAPLGNLACLLSGSQAPFSQETLDALYPSNGKYVNQIAQRTNQLVKSRFLLPEDAELHKTAAGESPFGN